MKILFDHQIFSVETTGGISRYHAELANSLYRKNIEVSISLFFSNNKYLTNNDIVHSHKLFPNSIFNLKIRNNTIKNTNLRISKNALRKQDFDVFHPTYYNTYFMSGDLLHKKPFVVTIHDMIHEQYMPNDPTIKLKKILIEKANKVIAISEHTKTDILKYVNINPDKIEVIYHGNSFDNKIVLPTKEITQLKPYILFVGARQSYKNFNMFAKAFALISHKYSDIRLVCTGKHFSAEENELLAELKIKEKVKNIFASEEELISLYKNAEFLAYPSLYEGFGLPILEAFTLGCPIVISNASCFPEIAQDAALYFEPNHIDSICFQIEKLLNNRNLRTSLIDKGYERAKFFSWDKTADKTIDVYKSVL